MTPEPDVHHVPTLTHGRVLVRPSRAVRSRGLLAGFHGYAETAAIQLARLEALPGAAEWTLVSLQGLHRFYRGRSREVVASWMTREDRELAIADNLAYVTAALASVPHDPARIVYAGFSQGVAMAFRAAVGSDMPAMGVIGVGGDVPPELWTGAPDAFPPVLLVRGEGDQWLTAAQFTADVEALERRGTRVTPVVHAGGHEWDEAVSEADGTFLRTLSGSVDRQPLF